MKKITLLVALFWSLTGWAQAVQTYTQGLSKPKGILLKDGFAYVSNIDWISQKGKADAKDGSGWITKINLKSKKVVDQWVSGLNAPKGMAILDGQLLVADIDEVAVIDMKAGKVKQKVAVPGAKFLSDIVCESAGPCYISDTKASAIYSLNSKFEVATLIDKLKDAPVGIAVDSGKIFYSGWGTDIQSDWTVKDPGRVNSVDLKTKEVAALSKPIGALDGIARTKKGNWIVTFWPNSQILKCDGKFLDCSPIKIDPLSAERPSDIAYDLKSQLLYIPNNWANRVSVVKITD